MSNTTTTQSHDPVEVSRLKSQLRKWLEEIDVKCACAVGIKNFVKDHTLENPRVFVSNGRISHEPSEKVEMSMASAALFSKEDYALTGTSGCICYDISNTDFMVAVLWRVPFSDTLSENHFNMRCLRKGECNEALFKFLSEDAKSADGELMREENGYRLCGCMAREEKAILIVDCYESGHVGILKFGEPVHVGRDLEKQLREWIGEADVKTAVGIGINNFSLSQLLSPHVHIECGMSAVDPPNILDPQMAAPALFLKRKYSLKGTAGCMTYEIKDSDKILALMWSIPYGEFVVQNRFSVTVTEKTECNGDLFRKMYEDSKEAKDGEIVKENAGFQITAHMETGSRAVLIADIRSKKQSWSLW